MNTMKKLNPGVYANATKIELAGISTALPNLASAGVWDGSIIEVGLK